MATTSPPPPDGPKTLFVSSVEKAFQVLQAFRVAQRDFGLYDLNLAEISKFSGLDKSASQRFTNTLVKLGYLDKDIHTRRFRPALALTEFFYTYMVSNRLAEIAMPRLIEASRVHQTTVNLCEPMGHEISYTIRVPNQTASYRTTLPGRRMPMFCTAAGAVFLAYGTEQEAEEILSATKIRKLTEWTVTDLEQIRQRIEKTRKDGYCIGVQQSMPHEISTAAPVLDSEGRAIAAVQVPVFVPEWTAESAEETIAPLVMKTARAISGHYASEG